jgi:H+/Cl- antiporter ClcA
VGVGIATGAIIASTSALIFQQEPMSFPWQAYHGDRPHPFMFALLLSFAFAFVGWGLAKWLIGCSRKRRSRSNQDSKN